MKAEYLNDRDFLKQVDLQRIKTQQIKITILDWNENPLQDLMGQVTGGSINIAGDSIIRRTANLTVFLSETENNVTNTNHLLSLNKKVSLSIGIKNTTNKYPQYDILWFPLGVYVIIQTSLNRSTSGVTASLQLKDKMCLLNGECGGIIPASTTFNEIETIGSSGEIVVTYPTMYQIIQEAVHHWGGEPLDKIIISDLDNRVKKVMKWNGTSPLYCYNMNNGVEFTTSENIISELIELGYYETTDPDLVLKGEKTYIKYEAGNNVGYIYTDFYYTGGDLVVEAGGNVTTVLDSIVSALGNYEYFYDLDGNFRFQEIKNYLNTRHVTVELDKLNNSDYLVDQKYGKVVYEFDDSALITSYTNNPQFSQIKNDFIVWGERKSTDSATQQIRFHLAIDKKPETGQEHYVYKYEDPEDDLVKAKAVIKCESKDDFPEQGEEELLYGVYGSTEVYTWSALDKCYELVTTGEYVTVTSTDWRTEYYLQGVDADAKGIDSNYYYTELKSEWTKLYDIWGTKEKHKFNAETKDMETYFDPDFYDEVREQPGDCDFFLDFIDSDAAIGEFSVSNIGRRTQVLNDTSINCLFEPTIPDWVMIQADQDDTSERVAEAQNRGQNFTQVDSKIYSALVSGVNNNSAYDAIRDMLYQYTSYNESISLQCLPIYYLDVNTRIRVSDVQSNISGDYIIKSISIPFDSNTMMSITANKALEKI